MLRKTKILTVLPVIMLLLSLAAGCGGPKAPEGSQKVILATTTSTFDSGLLDILQPEFEKKTGYPLTVVPVGSGQAIAMAERGEADALLVHSPEDEQRIEEAGVAVNRRLVMHNDFVLAGPAEDPAEIKGKTIAEALKAIEASQALFLSRGDSSGTHKKELSIWEEAGLQPSGAWYQETGSGMGQTLNVAAEKDGYILTDRATYLALKKNNDLEIMVEGDAALLNVYHVMQVNPERFETVNAEGGKAFVEFMVAGPTQEIINSFGTDKFGQSLFVPDAGKNENELGK